MSPWLGDGVLITFLEDGIQRRYIGFRHVQCVRPDRDRNGVGHDANRPVPGIPAFLRRAVVLARVGTELRDAFHILEITQFLVEQGFVDRFADVFACARRRIVRPPGQEIEGRPENVVEQGIVQRRARCRRDGVVGDNGGFADLVDHLGARRRWRL